MLSYTRTESPAGSLLLAGDEVGLRKLLFRGEPDPAWREDAAFFKSAVDQLRAYFVRELQEFDVPLAPEGTSFQQRVWQELCTISYGQTITYGELARRIGNPAGSRAVGAANGANPISIIIPCHRVIGASGKLVGYGGGMRNKDLLLGLERSGLQGFQHSMFSLGAAGGDL